MHLHDVLQYSVTEHRIIGHLHDVVWQGVTEHRFIDHLPVHDGCNSFVQVLTTLRGRTIPGGPSHRPREI